MDEIFLICLTSGLMLACGVAIILTELKFCDGDTIELTHYVWLILIITGAWGLVSWKIVTIIFVLMK